MADALALLHRVRAAQADQARRDLAAALAAENQAAEARGVAESTLRREAAEHPEDAAHPLAAAYAAWRPCGLATLQRAITACLETSVQTVERRAALAESRAGARAVEVLEEARAAARRAALWHREQLTIEESQAGKGRGYGNCNA